MKKRTVKPILKIPQAMVVQATRYMLGRMSYAVSIHTDWLCDNWDELDENIKEIIKTDVEMEFERDDRLRADKSWQYSYPLGRDCDRNAWEFVRMLWSKSHEIL